MAIVLIDGNSIMFRAYFATANTGYLMQSKSGLYTNALYGFLNMIQKILSELKPTHILVAFDAGKQTFRHQQFEEYKGTRKSMPEELAMQIPYVKESLDIMGIKRLELLDYEADDIIATVAKREAKAGHEVIVVSGDKDLLQLVGENIKVMLTRKGISELEEYNEENFFSLMGFTPSQVIDYKGLTGDKSDNLPGIRGVGPKTAIDLLAKYHTLEGIIEAIPELKGKLKENIEADQELAKRSKYLATLYFEAPVPLTLDDLKKEPMDYQKLRSFYESVDFYSFIKKMDQNQDIFSNEHPKEEVKVEEPLEIILNDIDKLLPHLTKDCYLEVELDGENYHKANILGIALLFGSHGFFLDKHYLFDERIISYLENKNYSKKTIDSKKVIVALAKLGIEVANISFDFILGSYLVNPSYTNGDLRSIFDHFLQANLSYHDEIYGKKTVYQVPFEEVYAQYAISKCEHVKRVEEIIINHLKQENQLDLLYQMEIPLAKVLAQMELNGFAIDKRRLEEIGRNFLVEMKRLEQEIYDACEETFNIGSPKQLGVILFEKLGLGKGRKNKTGYSTAVDVLEQLAEEHVVPRLVLEYRKYSKLYSTYVVGLLNEIHSDGKVHTMFKQALTLTGRLSSVEPNIQNIPIRSEDGRIIRSAFVPSFDYLVSADYSQIELRVLAHMAKSKTMIDDFNHGLDLHASTASKVNGVPLAEVTKEMRSYAKAINFGLIYGMSDWGLSETLHISPGDAARFIEKYFEIYPEIKVFLDQLVEDAKRLGYSKTLFERRRYLPELKNSNHALRKFGERTAMNAPIQGTAADIIKRAMIDVQNVLTEKNLKAKLVAQVHDELVLDVPADELEVVQSLLKQTMEQATKLDVKLLAEVSVGKTWDLK